MKPANPTTDEMYDFILSNWCEHCLDDLDNPSDESVQEVYDWIVKERGGGIF